LIFVNNLGKCTLLSKFFPVTFLKYNFVHTHTLYPPYLVSTLPCETGKLQLLPISMAYYM